MTEQKDMELSALQAGDPAAWRSAWPSFWGIALRAARSSRAGLLPSQAEDAAAEAVEQLVSQIESITSLEHAKALLATIAARRAIDLARRDSAEKRRQPNADETGYPGHDAEAFDDRSDLERAELVLLVREALSVLDEPTRVLLQEKIGLQLTYAQLSLRHGLPLGTVCTKVARGLARVRATLGKSPALLNELKQHLR